MAATGRERILQAAAELFAAQGFAATSTREIAERAGVRQPSLYAHFRVKSDILLELLVETLRPAVSQADVLMLSPLPARDRLVALLDFDIRALFAGRRPVAVLGLLPEVRGPEFAEAHELRERLRTGYTALIRDVLTALGHPPGEEYLRRISGIVFAVVESINLRRYEDPSLTVDDAVRDTTTAILRILGA
ncbi:TetR/AcrR family transcriptional regulator [Actinoplanes sp. NBRC 101535]|uniref:TetR/AcrR family transcriptional regulator n=1 Tax=Actinoplanes sp. NBRC 101535 TaxID=3032196 RepID=UPI0024A163FE|nr:TetR/AcrR family transcriptional regulator [Actinoplanes sp. NBRC 101535]GLY05305.1 TetR family transcriptional regulator [Actinoplanes sp. NBRC 101535]